MKKLILLLVFLVPLLVNAQTLASPKAITADKDYYYLYGDTLEKDAAISQYYYVSDYCQDLRLQLDLDTLAEGYIKVNTVVYGSMDYANWVTLTGNITGQLLTASAATGAISTTFAADSTTTGTYGTVNYTSTNVGTSTITTAGATAATSSTLYKDVYYKYIKVTSTAVDSTQYGQFKYRILFNTNK